MTYQHFGWVEVNMIDSTTSRVGPPSFDPIYDDFKWNAQIQHNLNILRFVESNRLLYSPWKTFV